MNLKSIMITFALLFVLQSFFINKTNAAYFDLYKDMGVMQAVENPVITFYLLNKRQCISLAAKYCSYDTINWSNELSIGISAVTIQYKNASVLCNLYQKVTMLSQATKSIDTDLYIRNIYKGCNLINIKYKLFKNI